MDTESIGIHVAYVSENLSEEKKKKTLGMLDILVAQRELQNVHIKDSSFPLESDNNTHYQSVFRVQRQI
jgi:hypothetical protein